MAPGCQHASVLTLPSLRYEPNMISPIGHAALLALCACAAAQQATVAGNEKRYPPGSSLPALSSTAPPAPSGPGAPGTVLPPGDPLITVGGHQAAGSHVGGSTIGADNREGGKYTIGAQTLTRGGQITYQGTTYSLASNGKTLVVNGKTQSITAGAQSRVPNFATSSGYGSSSGHPYSSSISYASSSSSAPATGGAQQSTGPRTTASTGSVVPGVGGSPTSPASGPTPTGAAAALVFNIPKSCCIVALVLLLIAAL